MAEHVYTKLFVAGELDAEVLHQLADALISDGGGLTPDDPIGGDDNDHATAIANLEQGLRDAQDEDRPLDLHRDGGWLTETEETLQENGVSYVRWTNEGDGDPELTGYDPTTDSMVSHPANSAASPVITRSALVEAMEGDQLNDTLAIMERVDPECIGPVLSADYDLDPDVSGP